jgi:hypothetical protein
MARLDVAPLAVARRLFLSGITDMQELERLTGIAERTLINYRGRERWLDQKDQAAVQSLDAGESVADIAQALWRILWEKVQEIRDLPAEQIDPVLLDGLHKLVKSVKLMSQEMGLLDAYQALQVAHELTDFCLNENAQGKLDDEVMGKMFEVISAFSDKKLGEIKK